MSFAEAFVLGLVQGLTEFLPVSSSGHLVIVQHFLGFREPLLFFDIVVHLGTVVSLLVYFAKDLVHLLRDSVYGVFFLFRRKSLREIAEIAPFSSWGLALVIASVPAALLGLFFRDWFEGLFGSLRTVGLSLFGTSLILWLTRYFQTGNKEIERTSFLDLFVIGAFQGLAIIPGISRSGATITAALFVGLRPEEAFRFSFLLAIPAILGAGLLEVGEGLATWQGGGPALGVGFAAAALFGYLALRLLERVMRRGKLHLFSIYTLALGLFTLFLSK